MTTIKRDRIQFEGYADRLGLDDGGNGQQVRDVAASAWEEGETAYLESHGGGWAEVGHGRDSTLFRVHGLKTIADAADAAGWAAADDAVRSWLA